LNEKNLEQRKPAYEENVAAEQSTLAEAMKRKILLRGSGRM